MNTIDVIKALLSDKFYHCVIHDDLAKFYYCMEKLYIDDTSRSDGLILKIFRWVNEINDIEKIKISGEFVAKVASR